MNKKILSIFFCMLLFATIPIAVGTAGNQSGTNMDPTAKPQGIFDRTYVRGFILGQHTEGRTTTFFAVFVRYTSHSLLQESESGFFVLQRVSFTRGLYEKGFTGKMGMFYINGIFSSMPK